MLKLWNEGLTPLGLVICSALALIVFATIGGQDVKQATQDQAEYCKNVKAGLWYDSKENVKRKCKTDVDS